MFLTKIDIDTGKRLARKYLGSPQVMHAVVMKTVCGECNSSSADPSSTETQGRVLWRIDEGSFGTTLYILSPSHPNVANLAREAGLSGSEARTLDYNPFLSKLAAGQIWAFRLTANPTHAKSRGKGVRGKRYGHVTVEQQTNWLLDRAPSQGFIVLGSEDVGTDPGHPGEASAFVVRRERPVFNRRHADGNGRDRVTINRTVYEGLLQITDAQAFRRILINGLGPSKAYGCGLMTLARPHGC
ncbi:CRISPR-associated protein cas6/cse3/case, subtype I-e [Propionibacterium sp. oral taxon 192 str. F0372]|uniref:type I-E CRISPR-associated protein Cas6/Cse3/CasE n=1 Tax=Propionibacterium sp. oral taxon 192 TaxID=671222 RepID=UPI0003540705|nr:type I-E CRISPR-associated protein Cas6/Cse3/CasE [Propionibacterium sp. oral taxon 192]EPH04075.1 CRISPR-associated protein cas6/cse3/case, subtype I-e [Propionibacterium sp. oral taxon 192 str. F0372]